eukprot:9644402-Karenia_brevis.AAC.1
MMLLMKPFSSCKHVAPCMVQEVPCRVRVSLLPPAFSHPGLRAGERGGWWWVDSLPRGADNGSLALRTLMATKRAAIA